MNKNNITIRLERKEEYRDVENLVRESFWNVYRPGCLEHYLLNQLRNSPDFVKELDILAPYGVANPKPLFPQKDIPVKDIRLMGKNQNVLKLVLDGVDSQGNHKNVEAVYFNDAPSAYEELKERSSISVLYQAGINEYMGNKTVQLVIQDYI